jgi:phage-related protein
MSPSANFIKKKNEAKNQPIFLYKIWNVHQDGEGHWRDLYFTLNDDNFIFQNQLYESFPLGHDSIGTSTTGQINSVKLTLSNVSRLIQSYLELYDLRTKRLDIITVFRDLDEADAYLIDTFYIDNYTAGEADAVFSITTRFAATNFKLPGRKYDRNRCAWKILGNGDCQYAGGETVCDKTLTRCRVLLNSARYGGMPSVPARGIFTT